MFHRQSDSSMCVPSLGWMLNWVSHLPTLVGGLQISHGVLGIEQTSHIRHHRQIQNSYSNLQGALHQRHSSAPENGTRNHVVHLKVLQRYTHTRTHTSIHWARTLCRALVLPKQPPWLLDIILDGSPLRHSIPASWHSFLLTSEG